MKGLRKSVYI